MENEKRAGAEVKRDFGNMQIPPRPPGPPSCDCTTTSWIVREICDDEAGRIVEERTDRRTFTEAFIIRPTRWGPLEKA